MCHNPQRIGIAFTWTSVLEWLSVEFIYICTWWGEVMEWSRMCFHWDPEQEHGLSLFCSCMALLAALSGLRGLL